ncbi:MAG: hypothetical protein UY77_C0019G0004 [Candidatus Uhrbacteria bacterium GW2011_GWA2_53_10]|uniref:Preprotein translocase subunit SecD n=1 Tax=Candidatus Uhrbacteria bacterium GW2011_GWA2_53_10 TaxID=1618980 RepID=A0A0G1XNV8_9BACT|nr:MAG: hypothetical protein UY77_C0019G0004 [Candidatus Uhrbacteria bacterium GW2011_GWA2_53_10]
MFLLLVSCNQSGVAVNLSFKTTDPSKISVLSTMSENVIERLAYNLEQEIPDISVKSKGDRREFAVSLRNMESAEKLETALETPLNLVFAIEAPEEGEADIENEQYGKFNFTELNGSHISWVTAEDSNGKGRVVMSLTDGGKTIWQKILNDNSDKKVALFVRGGLVSMYTIKDEAIKDSIVISDIPSAELARVFADDVNVGTYVVFEVSL